MSTLNPQSNPGSRRVTPMISLMSCVVSTIYLSHLFLLKKNEYENIYNLHTFSQLFSHLHSWNSFPPCAVPVFACAYLMRVWGIELRLLDFFFIPGSGNCQDFYLNCTVFLFLNSNKINLKLQKNFFKIILWKYSLQHLPIFTTCWVLVLPFKWSIVSYYSQPNSSKPGSR